MPTQLSVVSGARKRKSPYVSMINAKIPGLYRMKEIKEEKEFRDKELALKEEEINRYEQSERDALEEAKKQRRVSTGIKLAELGVGTGLGLLSLKGSGGSTSKPTGGGILSTAGSFAKKTGTGLLDAAKEPSTWASGGAGAVAGSLIAKDEPTWKKALYGAGIGAGLNLITGGDAYSAAASAIMGGGLSTLADFF